MSPRPAHHPPPVPTTTHACRQKGRTHVRGGWYQRNNAAANPLIHPGQPGLQAAGWEPSPPADPSTDNQETA